MWKRMPLALMSRCTQGPGSRTSKPTGTPVYSSANASCGTVPMPVTPGSAAAASPPVPARSAPVPCRVGCSPAAPGAGRRRPNRRRLMVGCVVPCGSRSGGGGLEDRRGLLQRGDGLLRLLDLLQLPPAEEREDARDQQHRHEDDREGGPARKPDVQDLADHEPEEEERERRGQAGDGEHRAAGGALLDRRGDLQLGQLDLRADQSGHLGGHVLDQVAHRGVPVDRWFGDQRDRRAVGARHGEPVRRGGGAGSGHSPLLKLGAAGLPVPRPMPPCWSCADCPPVTDRPVSGLATVLPVPDVRPDPSCHAGPAPAASRWLASVTGRAATGRGRRASPRRVNSDRSPINTSWISRTYGGSASAPATSPSTIFASVVVRFSPAPRSLTTIDSSTSPLPANESVSTPPSWGTSNGASVGSRSTMLTRWVEPAIRFPVRIRNGTPRHRSLSTHIRAATNVSVVESGAIPGTSR